MHAKATRQRETFNQVINFFWTIISFIPVVWTWWLTGADAYLWLFIGISLLFGILPQKIIRSLQFSNDRRWYERLGVKTIRRFVQNGDAVNRAMKDRQTIRSRRTANRYLATIAMYERFHWTCLLFFLLSFIYAMYRNYWWLSSLIFLANIVYNICPLLLQQYNRIRIERLPGRRTTDND